MKKIFFITLLASSFNLFSQNTDLFQRWYVQDITINGATTLIPQDPIELPYVYLSFYNTPSGLLGSGTASSYNYYNCHTGFSGHVNYIDNNVFKFIDFTISQNDYSDCSTEFISFMNLYNNFYNNEITQQFNYNLTSNTTNNQLLLVTNNSGDTITYINIFFNLAPQELLNNNWYLNDLIINGIDNIPPNNIELPEITLNFTNIENGLTTYACDYLAFSNFFDYDLYEFYLYETTFGLISCGNTSNENFSNLYFNFFINNLPGPFTYSHTINNNEETLIITTPNQNQAIYKKTALAINYYKKKVINIYPNPIKNTLTLELQNTTIKEIKIYTVLGKEIVKTTDKKIDMSSFSNGIYIVKITSSENNIITKKFVKVGL